MSSSNTSPQDAIEEEAVRVSVDPGVIEDSKENSPTQHGWPTYELTETQAAHTRSIPFCTRWVLELNKMDAWPHHYPRSFLQLITTCKWKLSSFPRESHWRNKLVLRVVYMSSRRWPTQKELTCKFIRNHCLQSCQSMTFHEH